ETLSAALRYASAGVAVLPTHWPTAAGCCSCGCHHSQCWERAKHPLVPRSASTTDPEQIRRWWEQWPDANVGIAALSAIIIDLDPAPGAPDPLPAFAERWGVSLDDTVICRTGSGGWHLYFLPAPGRRAVWTGKNRLGPGCDVLTRAGAYAIAPPSTHQSLGRYAWIDGKAILDRPLTPTPSPIQRELARSLPLGWIVRVAPYWIVGRLGLSVEARQRLRRLLPIPRAGK
ncbi:MAG: bifunctional DNA primase/polymerase, partial [Tepidiformaceae bacterium]